jgi:glutaredoxin
MKYLFLSLSLLFYFQSFSQTKEIEVSERNENGLIFLDCSNDSDKEIEVKITLTLTGIESSTPSPIIATIPAKGNKELTSLKMTGGPASYSYNVSYTVRTTSQPEVSSRDSKNTAIVTNTSLQIPEKGILVFSKNGCGRCTYAHNFLEDNEVDFKEINISENDENSDFFWSTLKNSGFSGNSVQTPVIVVDGKVHTKLKDLKGFLKSISTK